MAKTISDTLFRELGKQNILLVPVLLITITHSTFDKPILISSDNKDCVDMEKEIWGTYSRKQGFYYFPFRATLPTQEKDEAVNTTITIDNTSLEYIDYIRKLKPGDEKPKLKMEIVFANDSNNVIYSSPQLNITNISYDKTSISFQLEADDLSVEPIPSDRFSPGNFPNIFI